MKEGKETYNTSREVAFPIFVGIVPDMVLLHMLLKKVSILKLPPLFF
jgi:hypothetical protein